MSWGTLLHFSFALARQHPPQVVVVLVGIPGSGKSTFASRLLAAAPPTWTRVNQDTLGTRARCISAAEEALRRGSHVLVDRCNFDEWQRSHWLHLRYSQPLHQVAVFLDVPVELACQRVLSRDEHEGQVDLQSKTAEELRVIVLRMASMLQPPARDEGFDAVLRCSCKADCGRALSTIVAAQKGSKPLRADGDLVMSSW